MKDSVANIDNLNEEELRFLLKQQLVRNVLIVKENNLSMFRYEVEEGIMWFMFNHPIQGVQRMGYENYLTTNPGTIFTDAEHERCCNSIRAIIENPNEPKIGAQHFTTLSGNKIRLEYESILDEQGNVRIILGQMVDIMRTKAVMQKTIDTLNKQIENFQALSQPYGSIIGIDLNNYSFEVLRGTPTLSQVAKHLKDARQIVDLMCTHDIIPEHHKAYRAFLDEETLQSRLEGHNYISQYYKSIHMGWVRACCIPVAYDKKGLVSKVLYTSERSMKPVDARMNISQNIERDSLTGLLTRDAGKDMLCKHLDKQNPFILARLTCDYFDSYVELLGRVVGDKILVTIASVLKNIYGNDKVMRMGTNGFCILIDDPYTVTPEMNDDDLTFAFSAINQQLESAPLEEMGGIPIKVSAAIMLIDGTEGYTCDTLYDITSEAMEEVQKVSNGRITVIKKK